MCPKTIHHNGPSHATTDVILDMACLSKNTGSYLEKEEHKKRSQLTKYQQRQQTQQVTALKKTQDCHLINV